MSEFYYDPDFDSNYKINASENMVILIFTPIYFDSKMHPYTLQPMGQLFTCLICWSMKELGLSSSSGKTALNKLL